METLPNEVIEIILSYLPANKIVEICHCSKIFSSICDWSFWRKKANADLKISASYFDFPLTTSEGSGSFQEIPFIQNYDIFIRPLLVFSDQKNAILDKGIFRYYQILSRFELQPELMIYKSKKFRQSFIEAPSFFLRAQKTSQSSIIPALFHQISCSELSAYFEHINNFTEVFGGRERLKIFITKLKYNSSEQGFVLSMLNRLISSEMFEEFKTIYNIPDFEKNLSDIIKFILEIEEGIISKEFRDSLLEAYSSKNHRYIFSIFHLLYLKKNIDKTLLPKQIEFLIDNQYVNYGDYLFCKSLEAGNEELLEVILQQKENSVNLPHRVLIGGNMHDNVEQYAYRGGNPQIIRRIKTKHKIDDHVGDLSSGYLSNCRPEDYFSLLQQVQEFHPKFLRQIFETKDCDILSLCLSAHERKHSNISPLKIAVDLFTKNLRFALGHLDVIAWVLRVLKNRSIGMEKKEISRILHPLTSEEIFQFEDISENDLPGQITKKLSKELILSKLMFQDGIRSMIEN